MSATAPIYFVTGANRGIGLAMVKELLSRHSDAIVFAGVRDPSSATALNDLRATYSSRLHLVKFVVGDVASNQAAAMTIENAFGRVDTVIANAGIGTVVKPILETPPDALNEHYAVNATGLVVLFQAFHTLLKASKTPKFIGLSSGGGSLTAFISLPAGYAAYGSSKAAANYILRRIHFEHDWIVAFPLSPGIVETDMAKEHRILDESGTMAGVKESGAITIRSPEEGAAMLISIIDKATREGEGGEFVDIDGSRVSW